VDLASSHHTVSSAGAWWNAIVFTFQSRIGTQLIYRRKHVVLTLANKEGGAHVDKDIHPDYARLLTDSPLSFTFAGTEVETPDLARLNTRRFALFLFPGSYSENQFANYLPTFRAIRYLYSLALLHDAPLAKATSGKTRNDRWSCRPSRTKRIITWRLSMPAEVSCEGNAREAGETRPIASKPASQNTKLLKFDPSKIIGKPKGCLRYAASDASEF